MTMYQKTGEGLFGIIDSMGVNPENFVKNPGIDFSRNRKLDFATTMKVIITMGGGNIRKELNDYFSYDECTPTSSAFIQQRAKINDQAFKYVFNSFNQLFPCTQTYEGYRLLAIDASTLAFADGSINSETYVQQSGDTGYNRVHLNASYDFCENRYTDLLIHYGEKVDEKRAFCDFIDRAHME